MALDDPFRPTGQEPAYAPPSYGSAPRGPSLVKTETAPPQWGPPLGPTAGGWGPPVGPGLPGQGPVAYGPADTSSRAIVALVLSIASWCVFPFVPAVVALLLTRSARLEIAASGGRLGGDGLISAATVIAWLNIALCTVIALGLVVLVVTVLQV